MGAVAVLARARARARVRTHFFAMDRSILE